jgi:hypothetical protein
MRVTVPLNQINDLHLFPAEWWTAKIVVIGVETVKSTVGSVEEGLYSFHPNLTSEVPRRDRSDLRCEIKRVCRARKSQKKKKEVKNRTWRESNPHPSHSTGKREIESKITRKRSGVFYH